MTQESYEKIMAMVADSPYHKWWPEEILESHIDTPLSLGQFIVGENDDETFFFFATWAFPEEKHLQEYLRTRCFPEEGFHGQGEDIWIVDFICLGGRQDVATAFRCVKSLVYTMGYDKFFWLRTEKNKIGWHSIKG
jgi:hemolysin-activating ACP:hemolysin acyltransferase